MALYVRGDLHGQIRELQQFAYEAGTTRDDILIILGDAGFNYYVKRKPGHPLYVRDDSDSTHRKLARLPLTILVVQGNHEAPAWCCEGFDEIDFGGSKACQSQTAPNVIYLKNGEIYEIEGRTFLCLGGAYSVDKCLRQVPYDGLPNRSRWFPEEQMTDDEMELAKENLARHNFKVDYVLAHTCPISKMPVDLLMEGIDSDNRMELMFENLAKALTFRLWLFGHFHGDRWIDDKYRILFHDTIEL